MDTTPVDWVELENFSSKAQCKFIFKSYIYIIYKSLCTTELNTCSNTLSYYINEVKGTVDNFLQLVPQISPVCQL